MIVSLAGNLNRLSYAFSLVLGKLLISLAGGILKQRRDARAALVLCRLRKRPISVGACEAGLFKLE